jgi:aspartate/methionine/tyrosine aminotransferase
MYAMVRFDANDFDDGIVDDLSFMRLLHMEENVVVLPGCAFGMVGGGIVGCASTSSSSSSSSSSSYAFRVVFCAPEQVLRDAAERISAFCLRHKRM